MVSRSESYTPTLPSYFGSQSMARGFELPRISSSVMTSRRYAIPVVYTVYGTEYWLPWS